jgi:hypothetical protein
MAKEREVIVSELDNETLEALNDEEQKGIKLLNITEEPPKQIVEEIRLFVDDILAKNYNDEKLREFALQLGTVWGKMVEKEYKWNWKSIDFGDGDANVFLLSPKEYYCCNPLYFLYKIVSANNAGLDGKNDNTVLLLFNMLEGIEKQKPAHKYQVLS